MSRRRRKCERCGVVTAEVFADLGDNQFHYGHITKDGCIDDLRAQIDKLTDKRRSRAADHVCHLVEEYLSEVPAGMHNILRDAIDKWRKFQ